MNCSLHQEVKELILKAKKVSIAYLDPIVREELIFLAFIEVQHPLWIITKQKLSIDEIAVKNFVFNKILNNKLDDPESKENLKKEKEYFQIASKEAQKKGLSELNAFCLFRALFLIKQNSIVDYFEKQGKKTKEILEVLDNISYLELVEAVDKGIPSSFVPSSRRVIQATESFAQASDLQKFGRNLNDLAKNGKLDEVYFRDEEIAKSIEILCRRRQNNPILIGSAGVGKTAIAEGIAQLIVSGKVPEAMKDKQLIEISLTTLIGGTSLRGQFEEKLQSLIQQCEKDNRYILFIDEIHMIIGAGGEKGVSDAANILKPALARGVLRCIGATTTAEYNRHILKDKALVRRFQPITVSEPTVEQTVQILKKAKGKYEEFHKVKVTDEAIQAACELAGKHIKDRCFPGKAIDLVDHACARESINLTGTKEVTGQKIMAIIAKEYNLPIINLLSNEGNSELTLLEKRLKERVIGQNHAVEKLARVMRLTKTSLDLHSERPDGVFFFVGPTGVGKTELAKSLTEALLGDESRLVRFDMSEYKDATSVSKVIGAAPGYVGHGTEGRLLTAIRACPNSVFLFDEIEKAHPDIIHLIGQICQKGILESSESEAAYFSNATIILTSNIGANILKEEDFAHLENNELNEEVHDKLRSYIEKKFEPSFLNGVDEIIYFHPLSKENTIEIIKGKIAMVVEKLKSKGLTVKVDHAVPAVLAEQSYSLQFGAKHTAKILEEKILKPIAELLLSANKKAINASVKNGQVIVE